MGKNFWSNPENDPVRSYMQANEDRADEIWEARERRDREEQAAKAAAEKQKAEATTETLSDYLRKNKVTNVSVSESIRQMTFLDLKQKER